MSDSAIPGRKPAELVTHGHRETFAPYFKTAPTPKGDERRGASCCLKVVKHTAEQSGGVCRLPYEHPGPCVPTDRRAHPDRRSDGADRRES